MEELLSSNVFRYLIFPLLSVGIGVLAKVESRPSRLRIEDFSVGLELLRAALLIYVVLVTDQALKLTEVTGSIANVENTLNKLKEEIKLKKGELSKLEGELANNPVRREKNQNLHSEVTRQEERLEEESRKSHGEVTELMGRQKKLSSKFTTSAWIILAVAITLWGTSTFVRRWGWKRVDVIAAIRQSGANTLVLLNFSPKHGAVGKHVTFSGVGFGAGVEDNRVLFSGNVSARIVSASATEVIAEVPNGAMTGPVTIATPRGMVITTEPFTFVAQNSWWRNFRLSLKTNIYSEVPSLESNKIRIVTGLIVPFIIGIVALLIVAVGVK